MKVTRISLYLESVGCAVDDRLVARPVRSDLSVDTYDGTSFPVERAVSDWWDALSPEDTAALDCFAIDRGVALPIPSIRPTR